jgi:hypothetical protein
MVTGIVDEGRPLTAQEKECKRLQEEIEAHKLIFRGKVWLARSAQDDNELLQIATIILSLGDQLIEARVDKKDRGKDRTLSHEALNLLKEIPTHACVHVPYTFAHLWEYVLNNLGMYPHFEIDLDAYIRFLLDAPDLPPGETRKAFERVVREHLSTSFMAVNHLLTYATTNSNKLVVEKAWHALPNILEAEELLLAIKHGIGSVAQRREDRFRNRHRNIF